MIANSMLKDVRRHAGLGDPPNAYNNNVPESANALIKHAVKFKENNMPRFCEEMGIFLLQQKEDIESTVISHGPYSLAHEFSSFQVSPDSWFKMTTKQKEADLKRFHAAKMSKGSETNTPNQANTTSPQQHLRLSIDLLQSRLSSAPAVTLQSISSKAEHLLNKEGSVLLAPGHDGTSAFVVESQTSVKPHYVTVSKNGKITCEDCPGWKASKICAHALAVAEKSGIISKYLKWLCEKGPTRMNVTALVTCDGDSGTGQKRSKKSTSRRKGGRAEKQAPIITTADRPALVSEVSSQVHSTTTVQPQPPPLLPLVPPPLTHQPNAAYSGDSEAANFCIGLLRFCPYQV